MSKSEHKKQKKAKKRRASSKARRNGGGLLFKARRKKDQHLEHEARQPISPEALRILRTQFFGGDE